MIWVDPIYVVSQGRKRHAYDDTSVNSQAMKKCRAADSSSSLAARNVEELDRMKGTEFALLPNACMSCVRLMSLTQFREENRRQGDAAKVEYDPFGVFAVDEDEDQEAESEAESDSGTAMDWAVKDE